MPGGTGNRKEFRGDDRTVKYGRISKSVGPDGKTKSERVLKDGTKAPLWYTPRGLIDGSIRGHFYIPKYESWHKKPLPLNPYNHFFFPTLEDGQLGFTLKYCEKWDQVEDHARQMNYNTEHVFEVQQLKLFFATMIYAGWIGGNSDMENILFDPQC
ncbi:uncharacterized protein LY89DRAFT_726889 [Mollisia scopiformis]|uniref:Uncharacterized protein n=1 Tax=Mollisia scopiformis TaxID=149040 RepID=A0A194XVT4_MOLSC|nr:uncharacterized protein LY89DRAFT_726889 [Mollisia scopiformis]KUJ23832.1 hypothetical protein LY89DRAFT_726889 [Mollisia scopiformis]